MKKQYEVQWCPSWDGTERATLVVEIDQEVLTEERMHEVNNFWSGHEARLLDEANNILSVILKLMAQQFWHLSLEVADPADALLKSEGFCGLEGLTIKSWDMQTLFPSDEIAWGPV